MPQTDGGYLGSDFEAFFSAVVSGAAGIYLGMLQEDAGIETDLVVRPGQRVSVSGDTSLPQPPRWGSGGFTVQQFGSLTLQSVAVSSGLSVTNGGNAVLMACVAQLASLTVTDSNFSASATTLGGSISLINAGSVTLEEVTFAMGTELAVGGGTSLSLLSCGGQLSSLSVTNSSFSMDSASVTTLGGSISLNKAGSVTLEEASFAEGAELTVEGGTSLSLSRMDVPADVLGQLRVGTTVGSVVRLSEVTVTTTNGTQWAQLQPGKLVASTNANGTFMLDPPANSFFDWFVPVRSLTNVGPCEFYIRSTSILVFSGPPGQNLRPCALTFMGALPSYVAPGLCGQLHDQRLQQS